MKIKELVKEGFWSGLGNLAHGAIKGATGAMQNAPTSMRASTNLAADPSKMKALPNTFGGKKIKPIEPVGQEPAVEPVNVPGFTVIDQDPVVIKYRNREYALNSDGEWYAMGARGTKAPLVKEIDPTLEKMLDKVAGFQG